jgi:hypothetical protein
MADAIAAMADPTRRAAYGQKAAARAASYGVEQAKARYWSVIREVLGETRVR